MDSVESTRAPEPVGPYPHARRAGPFLFVSGTGPRQRGSSKIPQGFEAQCRATLDNVGAILGDAGATWADVVDVTVFLTNMDADFKTMNRIYAEYFKDPRPARTTVEVTKLPTPISIEIKAVAYLANSER